MTKEEFKERLDRLGLSRQEAADRLGLSLRGLFHQLSGERHVTRQTEMLLDQLERGCVRRPRRLRRTG
jgi:hypothetical protein